MEPEGVHEQLHAPDLGVRVLNLRGALFPAAVVAAVLAGRGVHPPAASAAEPVSTQTALTENYGGLPEGPGRDAVYFNCTACHSLRQFTQQRLPREEWDQLLDTMVQKNGMHPMQPWARRLILNYLATHFRPEEDLWQGLPAGPGRDIVFSLCQACHSLAIVKQQGLDRASWDETLVWMVEEQGMPPLAPENLKLALDYLAKHYGRNSN
jgi:cytochrome c5